MALVHLRPWEASGGGPSSFAAAIGHFTRPQGKGEALSPHPSAQRGPVKTKPNNMQEVSSPLCERSLALFSKEGLLRAFCIRAVTAKAFEFLMLQAIVANCVTLAADSSRPGFDETAQGKLLQRANYAFIALFGLEATMKIIAMGFVGEKGTYLRDGEHCMGGCRT